MPRKMNSCVVCGCEVVPQGEEVRFIAVVVWCPSAKQYDLLPLFVVSKWSPGAKKYYLLPLCVGCVFEAVPQC